MNQKAKPRDKGQTRQIHTEGYTPMYRKTMLTIAAFALLAGFSSQSMAGIWANGIQANGVFQNGIQTNGLWQNGVWSNSLWINAWGRNGTSFQGLSLRGLSLRFGGSDG